MATSRISQRELYILRNAIPIDRLIRAMPALAANERAGVFRFLCPLCSGFNTATNPKTNLARCFLCNRNFNTIDLVMQVNNLNFKDAVAALHDHFRHLSQAPVGTLRRPTKPSSSCDSSTSFTSIRQVLECALAKTK